MGSKISMPCQDRGQRPRGLPKQKFLRLRDVLDYLHRLPAHDAVNKTFANDDLMIFNTLQQKRDGATMYDADTLIFFSFRGPKAIYVPASYVESNDMPDDTTKAQTSLQAHDQQQWGTTGDRE